MRFFIFYLVVKGLQGLLSRKLKMGSLMAKLAHDKATTYEALQNLEEKIIATEELMRNSQLRYERIIRSLVMATFFIYVLSCFVIYLYLLPSSWLELFLYNCPLLVVFPLGMAVTKKVITLYFNIKWNRYSKYLGDLQEQKKGILDQVMETENYKTGKYLISIKFYYTNFIKNGIIKFNYF